MTIDNELKDYCSKAKQMNCDNLMTILRDNEKTQYGMEHEFDKINSIEDYRKTVPLSDYSSFEKYIERMRSGEENVLTVYPLSGFCRTSGSTGRSKYIPLSFTALKKYADGFERSKEEMLRRMGSRHRFFLNAFRADLSRPPAKEALFTEYNFRYIYEQGIMDMNEYIGGKVMLFTDGEHDILYAKVREALCDPDIKIFECIYMYELLNFFSYLEGNWESICSDIDSNTIPSHINLSPEMSRYLLSIETAPERTAEIRRECSRGYRNIAKRLWKDLVLICGIINRSNMIEEAMLTEYTGEVKRYGHCYCSSECSIAAAADTNSFEYVMMPGNAFFEFLPYDADTDEALLPHELKKGELYEPVITNFSGLYRYRMGDIVKVTGHICESPLMEFMFRKGQALNIAGEKYDICQLEKAVFDLRQYGITAEDYCIGECFDTIPGRYAVLMAVKDTGINGETASEALDRTLSLNNSEYEDLRKLGMLEKPSVLICDRKAFSAVMTESGSRNRYGHNKSHHLLKGEVSEKTWISILERIR